MPYSNHKAFFDVAHSFSTYNIRIRILYYSPNSDVYQVVDKSTENAEGRNRNRQFSREISQKNCQNGGVFHLVSLSHLFFKGQIVVSHQAYYTT